MEKGEGEGKFLGGAEAYRGKYISLGKLLNVEGARRRSDIESGPRFVPPSPPAFPSSPVSLSPFHFLALLFFLAGENRLFFLSQPSDG